MNIREDYKNIAEALAKVKEVDIVKYTELLLQYEKIETLKDINKNLFDIDTTLREK